MVLDANLELRDAAFNGAQNTAVNGSWVNLGRAGFPQGAQFIVGADTVACDGTDSAKLEVRLEVTYDNGTTIRTVTSFEWDPAAAYAGQLVRGVEQDFNPQEYAAASLDVRVVVSPTGDNTSNNVTADKIYAFLGAGEKQTWGRLSTADTLYDE